MAGRFEGKVALITGAASGIGRAAAVAFAREGAAVVLCDVAPEGEAAAAQIREQAGQALFVRADVSRPEEVASLFRRTRETFGGLDCAYNNAGLEGPLGPTANCSDETFDRLIAVNLKGVWLCMKHELPLLLARGGGAIVNCASVAGLVGFATLPAYTASKHGVVGLTRAAALEYATAGVRVNAVCPGVIRTPMVDRVTGGDPAAEAGFVAREPIGRMGSPEEVADAVLWLCSGGASFVTGQALAVDGGWVAQ